MIYEIYHRSNYHGIKNVRELWDKSDFNYLLSYINSNNLYFKDPVSRRSIGDFTYWLHGLVFSEHAVNELKSILESNGEFKPIICDNHKLFVYNVSRYLDVLDKEKSEIKYFTNGKILNIRNYEFIPDLIPQEPIIFKLNNYDRCTYVNKAFADLVISKNLTGFKFISIWPDNLNQIYGQQKPNSISEIFERELNNTLQDDFDSEIWFNVCDKIGNSKSLSSFPKTVVFYYASRYLEWEVGNGGFAQAAMNIPELFELAALGYEALNRPKSADLIRKAIKLIFKERFKIIKASKTLESAFRYFSESRFQKLDALLDEVDWCAEYDRIDYVRKNKADFISIDFT